MLVNVKLDGTSLKGLPFQIADFISLFNFEFEF